MTQTIERELRLKFESILNCYYQDNPKSKDAEEFNAEVAKILASAAKEVAGIAKAEKKFRDPNWDLLHGKTPEITEQTEMAQVYTDIATRLEIGLRRGEFPQSNAAQMVYKWIHEREKRGQSLNTWISWAMEGKRAEFSFIYHQNPETIKRDWLQVFPSDNVEIAQPDTDGGYR